MGLFGPDCQDYRSPLWARLEDKVRIIGKQQLASPKEVNEERNFPVITVLVIRLSLPSLLSLLRDSLQPQPHPRALPNAGVLVAGQTFYSLLSDYKFCCAVLYPTLYSRDLQCGEHQLLARPDCRGAGIAEPGERSERKRSQTLSRCAQQKVTGQVAMREICLGIRNKPFCYKVVTSCTGWLCFSFLGHTQNPAGQSLPTHPALKLALF